MKLSIIIPAHNEQENIVSVISRIEDAIKIPHELVVVNDHSSDFTKGLVAGLSNKYDTIRLVENNLDKGFANAVRTGLYNARGEALVIVMADLCDDLLTIEKMYARICDGYDIVCAARYIHGGARIGGSKIKAFFSSFVGWSLNILLRVPTHDIANAFKMYRKEVIDSIGQITATGFEISMEIALKGFYKGYKMTEVATVWREREKGKSSFRMFRLIPNYFKVYTWALFRRLRGVNHAAAFGDRAGL